MLKNTALLVRILSMNMKTANPVWVEIDLRNLDHNIKEIKRKAAPASIVGVVKADAYGHGMIETAGVLKENGVDTFAVAKMSEVAAFREVFKAEKLILLPLAENSFADKLVEYDVTPVICSYDNAEAISSAATEKGKILDCYIAVDTGMGRIGYLPWDEEAVAEIKRISGLPGLKIKGLTSHMAVADEKDKTYSRYQAELFDRFYDKLVKAGISVPERMIGNSATVMDLPEYLYDMVRPGIILYGCYPSEEVDKEALDLRPVMSVKGVISHLKEVPEGFCVSYGRKFRAKRPSKIATIGLGYADGYPRAYSNAGRVIVNGVICPIAGNICMDQCMIDVTDVPDVKLLDEVTIMGREGDLEVTPEYIAKATNTINYEVLCAFGQRLPKVYIR